MPRTSAIWGTAIAVALGACGSRPVMQPTPMFESNTRNDQLREGPVEAGRPDVFERSPRDARGAPARPLPGGSLETKTDYAAICDGLRQDVHAEVYEIDGGARLVLRPASPAALIRVRRAARELAVAVTTDTGARTEPPCALFELAERGARFRIREEGVAVIVEVTGGPEDRAAVRQGLRRYADVTTR